MRLAIRMAGACGLALLAAAPALAQGGGPTGFPRLDELEARFRKQAEELERGKLAALAALAKGTEGAKSETAYRALFDLAVARGLYAEAEAPARAYLAREAGRPETTALAASIALIARAGRGESEQSLADLEGFLKRRAAAGVPDDRRLSPAVVFVLSEAYLDRLIQGGRYDVARKACRLAASHHPAPALRAYFERREARMAMVGAPAPAIEGTDVDGKTVRLADFKGKVVLVDFWTTWCPPCVAAFPQLRRLAREHREEGFVVLGVNLDALGQPPQGAGAKPEATTDLRRFLVAERAGWPNLVGPGAEAAAQAYRVEEVPSSFLVGRDGTIRHVELRAGALDQAVAEALHRPAP